MRPYTTKSAYHHGTLTGALWCAAIAFCINDHAWYAFGLMLAGLVSDLFDAVRRVAAEDKAMKRRGTQA